LTEKGVAFETINYTDKPLAATTLKELLHRAGLSPRDVLRTNEVAYKEEVAGKDLTDAQLLQIIAKRPELLQRPIVVRGSKAVLARPLEKLAELGLN
jgi:arsenate reductase